MATTPAGLPAGPLPCTDPLALVRALVDVPSVSGEEGPLADLVEAALRDHDHLEVLRDGHAVLARTRLGRAERVVVAGHLDTVPLAAGSLPARREGDVLVGRGTVDMKGGVAMALVAACTVTEPVRDVTYVFYDCEEVESARNGLARVARSHPDWLEADLAVLGEPTEGAVEGGCQGSLRLEVTVRGLAAHSARAWRGRNAVHAAADVLDRLRSYEPRRPVVEGLEYREGLQAVGISGGIAGNVVPDVCVVEVNHRFAPDRDAATAIAHVREVLAGLDVELSVVDAAEGARPGLDRPAARAFVGAVAGVTDQPPRAKLGWTDVSRFAALDVPALNFGPGDSLLAHADDERVPLGQVRACTEALREWLRGGAQPA